MRILKMSVISVVSLLLMFGLVGCGSKQPSSSPKGQQPSSSQNSGSNSISSSQKTITGTGETTSNTSQNKTTTQNNSDSLTNLMASNYFSATKTVDDFLNSWLTYDSRKGLALLSTSVTKEQKQSDLEAYFSKSSPAHSGYEVVGYKKINDNKFYFHVWMYANAMGLYGKGGWSKSKPTTLSVVKENGKWQIDNLPKY